MINKLKVEKSYCDDYNHVSHIGYSKLLEDQRWLYLKSLGVTKEYCLKIKEIPVLVEYNYKYIKESFCNEELTIITSLKSIDKDKIIVIQEIKKDEKLCLTSEFCFLMFNLETRKKIEISDFWVDTFNKK